MEWSEIRNLTLKQARFVRALRVQPDAPEGIGHSWREIALICHEEWDGDWESNQIAGMEICQVAASLLGENYLKPPWN